MAKPNITGRVPQALKDEFDAYRDERDLSSTDAQRELLREGLKAKGRDPYAGDEDVDHPATDPSEDQETAQFNQDGGTVERVAGVVMAFALAAIVANTLLGPGAALTVGVIALGAVTYLATVSIVRVLRRTLSADDPGETTPAS